MQLQRPSKLLAAFLVILVCVTCDRITKLAAEGLRGSPPRRIAGIVTLSYVENRGAMLSLGAELPENVRFLIFTAGVGILLAGIAAVLLFGRNLTSLRTGGLSLMLAGGASNLFDRLFHDGRVVDFVTIGLDGVRTGIFNLADVAIMAGAGMYLVSVIQKDRVASSLKSAPRNDGTQ